MKKVFISLVAIVFCINLRAQDTVKVKTNLTP